MTSNEIPHYDPITQKIALSLIARIREGFALSNGMEAGTRFKDDEYVLSVLETQAKEGVFTEFPITSIAEALETAARTDYWYAHEKQYDESEEELCDE